jgi:hypothetical protein
MNSTFWTNTIWYILLLFTSIVSVVFIFKKTETPKFTCAFLLSVFGFTVILESILVVWLEAYRYYPKIVSDTFQDAVFGNIFSQISLSSTAVLLIVYNLSYIWYFILPLLYYFIEELFLSLGIYNHAWYKSFYTIIGLILLFELVKKWHSKLINSNKYFINYLTLFLASFALNAITITMSLKLLGIQIFKANFFVEVSKNHTAINLIYQFVLINILINLYKYRLHRIRKVIIWLLLYIGQYLLFKTGILYIRDEWFFVVTIFDFLGCYTYIAVLDHWLHKETTTTDII